jgi:hypothetical protein
MKHGIQSSLFVIGAALVGCGSGCDSDPGVAPDAGAGGLGDGGSAASSSASGSTTSTSTTASSSTGGGGDPGWQPVAWAAPCEVLQATNPLAAIPKLTWGPCPNAAAGCESAIADTPEYPPFSKPSVTRYANGYRIGLGVSYPDLESRVAVFDPDGTPLVVWRTQGCSPLLPRVTPERVWFGAQYGFNPPSYLVETYDKVTTATALLPIETLSQLQDANDSTLALEGVNGNVLTIYDRVRGTVKSFDGPGLSNKVAQPVGDVALFQMYAAFEQPEGWIWRRATQDIEPLVQPVGEYVADILSDGSTIVWIQVPPKEPSAEFWPQGDLWTSPFAETKAALVPTKRRPAPIVGDVPAIVGEGYYALFSAGDQLLHVYRLSDMHHWSFASPPQAFDFWDFGYIDDTWVYYQTVGGVFRQRLDALGPGDPPP